MTTEACVTKLAYLCGRGLDFRSAIGRGGTCAGKLPARRYLCHTHERAAPPMDRPMNLR